jgi:hypothetical protein
MLSLLQRFNGLLFNAGVASGSAAARSETGAAEGFCGDLARTLGSAFRVSLYRREPPELLASWGGPRRTRTDDPVLGRLHEGSAVNHPLPGSRLSVLPLPGAEHLAVAIEADSAALGRAARLLAELAEPEAGMGPTDDVDHLGDALDRFLSAAEASVGVPLEEMSRSQKQQVVRYLDDRGAFLITKAVEDVAARLGVTRFTIYNYLEESNRRDG